MIDSAPASRSFLYGHLPATFSRLIDFYELRPDAERLTRVFDAITRDWRGTIESSPDPSFSAISGNGIPLQFSVSLGARPRSLRFLSEVGAPGMSMVERLALSSYRLRELVALLDLQGAVPYINQLFGELFPKDPALVGRWTGGIGIAVAAAAGYGIRLRLYLNQRWGSVRERYHRIARVFALLRRRRSLAEWTRLVDVVSGGAIPYGVSIDILSAGIGRFKVYLAMSEVDSGYLGSLLDHLGLGHRTASVEEFLGRFELKRPCLGPWCLLPSVEFPYESDEQLGLKLDISFNHLQTSDAWLDTAIIDIATRLSIDPQEYRSVLEALSGLPLSDRSVELLQYGGLGFEDETNVRFNVYLAPAVPVSKPTG